MGIPISRIIEEQTCQKVDPANMTTFRKVVSRDLLPSNATDERVMLQRFFDANYRMITQDSILHYCPICQNVAHIDDMFLCIDCQQMLCRTHAAILEELPPPQPPPVSEKAAGDQSKSDQHGIDQPSSEKPVQLPKIMPRGICKPCKKKAFWRNLLLWPFILILRPLLSSFTNNGKSAQQPGKTILMLVLAASMFFANQADAHFTGNNHSVPGKGVFLAMTSEKKEKIDPAIARGVLEAAVKRGYDRRLGKAEFVYYRDLKISLDLRKVDERAVICLMELFRLEDVFTPIEDYHKPFLPDPGPDEVGIGRLKCFQTEKGEEVNHDPDEQTLQIRLAGKFGSGKTSGLYSIADQNVRNGLSCFIIDSKGSQFDSLLVRHPGKVIKLKIGRDVILNCWKYPEKISPMLAKIHDRHDSAVILTLGTSSLKCVSTGSKSPTVTFAKLFSQIPLVHSPKTFPDIKDELRQSLMAVFLDIINSPLFASINAEHGIDIAQLIKSGISLIIDSSEIAGTIHEDFFMTALLLNTYEDIRHDPVLSRKSGHHVLFAIDESTSIAASAKAYTRGIHPFPFLVTLCRGSGVSVVMAYHSPSCVPELLLSAHCTITASLVAGPDIMAVMKAMFLDEEQAKAIPQLPVGHGIMLLAGRCDHPFIVKWQDMPKMRPLTQAEIDAFNAPVLKKLPAIIIDPHKIDSFFKVPSLPLLGGSEQDILYLLRHIESMPYLNLTERVKALHLPSGTVLNYIQLRAILDELKSRKWVDYIEIQMSVIGGAGEYSFLTPDTRTRLFGSSKILRGGGGSAHNLLQHLVHKILTDRGIAASMEATI